MVNTGCGGDGKKKTEMNHTALCASNATERSIDLCGEPDESSSLPFFRKIVERPVCVRRGYLSVTKVGVPGLVPHFTNRVLFDRFLPSWKSEYTLASRISH